MTDREYMAHFRTVVAPFATFADVELDRQAAIEDMEYERRTLAPWL
jgi:hypothetical protein